MLQFPWVPLEKIPKNFLKNFSGTSAPIYLRRHPNNMPKTITKQELLELFKELEDAQSDLTAARSTNRFLQTAEDRLDLDLNIETLITRVDIAKAEYKKAKGDYLASQRSVSISFEE